VSAADYPNPLPRELAPGIHWLGQCSAIPFQGKLLHQYASVFLVAGEDCSVVVEGGLTRDAPVIEAQLESLIAAGVPEPKYLFLSHTEIPHAGGIGRFLHRFPEAVACGDVSDLHLVFPAYADRLLFLNPGDSLSLGGTDFLVVEAVFRDLPSTRWGFDTGRKVLFASDGFSYSHYHEAGHCGSLAEESSSLGIADQVALFAMAAFYWTQFVDVEPYITRLEQLVFDELDATLIAPTHGLPIGDPAATLPEIARGLRAGSTLSTTATLLDDVP
jgi:flavorubredoxin